MEIDSISANCVGDIAVAVIVSVYALVSDRACRSAVKLVEEGGCRVTSDREIKGFPPHGGTAFMARSDPPFHLFRLRPRGSFAPFRRLCPAHLVLGLGKIASNDSKMLISAGEA